MTEREAALTGMHEYQLRVEGKEKELQEQWTIARWLAWRDILISPYIKPQHKPQTAQAFCRFPWETPEAEELAEKAKLYHVTPDEEAALNKILTNWEQSRNNNQP